MNPTMNLEESTQKANALGYQNNDCLDCANLSAPTNATCKKCIADTPAFTEAMNKFMNTARTK